MLRALYISLQIRTERLYIEPVIARSADSSAKTPLYIKISWRPASLKRVPMIRRNIISVWNSPITSTRNLNFHFSFKWIGIIHLVRSQNFPKNWISYHLIRTRTCAYQAVRNDSFLENFADVLNGWTHSTAFVKIAWS